MDAKKIFIIPVQEVNTGDRSEIRLSHNIEDNTLDLDLYIDDDMSMCNQLDSNEIYELIEFLKETMVKIDSQPKRI